MCRKIKTPDDQNHEHTQPYMNIFFQRKKKYQQQQQQEERITQIQTSKNNVYHLNWKMNSNSSGLIYFCCCSFFCTQNQLSKNRINEIGCVPNVSAMTDDRMEMRKNFMKEMKQRQKKRANIIFYIIQTHTAVGMTAVRSLKSHTMESSNRIRICDVHL